MDALITLFFLLILWVLRSLQHQAIYALIAFIFKAKNIQVHSLPIRNGENLHKYWAHITFAKDRLEDWQYGLLSCAPQLTNTLLMLLVFGIIVTYQLPHLFILFLLALYTFNFIDGIISLGSLIIRSQSNGNDAWSAVYYFGIDIGLGRMIAASWYTLFLILSFVIILKL